MKKMQQHKTEVPYDESKWYRLAMTILLTTLVLITALAVGYVLFG